MRFRPRHPAGRLAVMLALVSACALAGLAVSSAAPQERRQFTVTAFKYGYAVSGSTTPEITVTEGDLVQIKFQTRDIAHSFTIEAYRIMRRVEPDKPITIDFRADKPGDFPFYCNLPIDERCLKETRGVLHVKKKS